MHVLPRTSRTAIALLLLGLAGCGSPPAAQDPEIPEDVKATIRALVDEGHVPGIVVGIVNPQGTDFFSYGTRRPPLSGPLDENSVFNIRGATKTFAGVLLADMVKRGEVRLDDPIQMYMPEGVRAPSRNGESITLAHLATHTSGLGNGPRSIEEMYSYLSDYTLRRDVGADYRYLSYGIRLLGAVLAHRAGITFEELLVQRIANELELSDTRVAPTPGMASRLAAESPAERAWYQVYSTARDLLTYLAANAGLTAPELYSAMQMTHEPRVDASAWQRVPGHLRPQSSVGLAWHISDTGNREIVWHVGGPAMYSTFIGFTKGTQTGAVVLVNGWLNAEDLGYQLLDPRASTAADISVLAGYTGWYEFSNGAATHIDLRDGQLTARQQQDLWSPVYAESETEFFQWAELGSFGFEKNEVGEAIALVLRDSDRRATRAGVIDGEALVVGSPRLSPDGRRLLFRVAGQIWLQPLDDGPATRLSEAGELGWNPSFSPDGGRLAFQRTVGAEVELCAFDIETDPRPTACSADVSWDVSEPVYSPDGQRVAFVNRDRHVLVLELASGRTRVVAVGSSDIDPWVSWGDDGQRLFFVDHSGIRGYPHRVLAVDVSDSTTTIVFDGLPEGSGVIGPAGPIPKDGSAVYFVGRDDNGTQTVSSLSLDDGVTTSIMELTEFEVQRVSPDGKWLALARQDHAGIWLAPLDRGRLEASDIRLVSQEGLTLEEFNVDRDRVYLSGHSMGGAGTLHPDFSFTPDGAALIYVADSRVWRQPLDGGEREEIPIRVGR